MFAAHNLERIGDRVTNIVERILFMTSGEMRELNPKVTKAVTNQLEQGEGRGLLATRA